MSNGIIHLTTYSRPEILEKVSNQVTIPQFGAAESLNVAVSGGIFCAEVRRKA